MEVLRRKGVLPGLKLDTGVQPLLNAAPGETWTAGLDTLAARAAAGYAAGARFSKWRAVLCIDTLSGAPSPLALSEAAHGLAMYAAVCQAAGLVPILEPEVLADGAHDANACAAATEQALRAVFWACAQYGVRLEACVLKPNMVTPGLRCPQRATPVETASATLAVLRRCVPPAVPGIMFLSGGQSEEEATTNLEALVRTAAETGGVPWALSFSFGRALQASALAAWRGDPAHVSAAQAAYLARCAANGAAVRGGA